MSDEVLRSISRALGRVEEGISRLRQDFTDEKAAAAISRKNLYQRQDDLTEEMARLREQDLSFRHSSDTLRDELQGLRKSLGDFKSEVQPPIEEFKRLKNLGAGIGTILAMVGIGIGTIIASGVEAAKELLRSWL